MGDYSLEMRVLITREFAEPLQSMFNDVGIDGVHVPLISLQPTGDPKPHGNPDGILITSSAVPRFVPNLAEVVGAATVVAVGEATAKALHGVGVQVHKVGRSDGVEALGLLKQMGALQGWYIGAKRPSVELGKELSAQGLVCWHVYENVVPGGIAEMLPARPFDAVSFTSGSAIRAFVDAVGKPQVPVMVLGESTRKVAADLGVPVTVVADEPTMPALVDAISRWTHSVDSGS